MKITIVGLMIVSATLDLLTTHIGFGLGLKEANGFANMLLETSGEFGLVMLKAAGVCFSVGLVLLLQSRYPRLWRGLALASAITFLVVASNTVLIVLTAA